VSDADQVGAGPTRRWPLTGTFSVEFVDGGDPDDSSAPPNFGHFGALCEPKEWSTDPRLPALLRWLADELENDQRTEAEWSLDSDQDA
jgi:hypothetical protein